jgi:hypothetical protein
MRPKLAVLALLLFSASAVAALAAPPAAALAKRVHIGQIAFTDNYQAGKPFTPNTTFKAGVPRIYGIFTFKGLRSDDTIGYNWYRSETRWNWDSKTVRELLGNVTEANTGTLRFWWDPDEKYIPAGYRMDVLVNGQVLQSGRFTVK